MMRKGKWITLIVVMSCVVILLNGCKKKEVPKPMPKPQKVIQAAKPDQVKLTPEEVRALARERLEVRKRKIPPFDRNKALRDIIRENFEIDLDALFPDGEYDLDKLESEKAVTETLEKRAADEISVYYSEQRLKDMTEDVESRFKFYKVGDLITVKRKRPDGAIVEEKGKLLLVNPKYIIIDGTRILFEDMVDPSEWAFDEKKVKSKRKNYIYNRFTLPKGEAKLKKKEDLASAVYAEFGCVQSNGKWVSLKRLMKNEIEPELKKREKTYMDDEIKKIKNQIAKELIEEGHQF